MIPTQASTGTTTIKRHVTWKTLTSSSPRTAPDSLHLLARSTELKPLDLSKEEPETLEEEAESALHSTGTILKAGRSKGWEEGWLTGSRVELGDEQ